jgi:hypothetical protein
MLDSGRVSIWNLEFANCNFKQIVNTWMWWFMNVLIKAMWSEVCARAQHLKFSVCFKGRNENGTNHLPFHYLALHWIVDLRHNDITFVTFRLPSSIIGFDSQPNWETSMTIQIERDFRFELWKLWEEEAMASIWIC